MKPVRQTAPKVRGCRGCPCRAPSGRCLDTRIRSGRCGDWVWYLRGNRQLRRLYVQPRDARSPRQLHERARFGAASTKYSKALTQAQREYLIAVGAKFRSRPRLAQSGRLTGQQYSIRMAYKAKAEGRTQKAEKPAEGLQTQGISLSTSDIHRSITGVSPEYHPRYTGRASKQEGRRKNGECRRPGSHCWDGKKRACRGSDFGLMARTRSGGVPQMAHLRHTCGTPAEACKGSGTPPFPLHTPSTSPPYPLPTQRGDKVGIRWGYGAPRSVPLWHSSGCPWRSKAGGNGTVPGEVI
jgi:hypothetical protein